MINAMRILSLLIFCFAMSQFLVALVNLLFRQAVSSKRGGYRGKISVLIPARNEEHNIGNILSDLQRLEDPELEILVYDDLSTDKTPEIVKQLALQDTRIRLIPGEELPAGWLGKPYACHRLAKEALGAFFLFLDADVRISGDIIRRLATLASEKRIGLLSVFPRQIMVSPGEWCAVPLMHFILLTLLPLILVRKSSFSSLSAANGQFMLFCAATYQAYHPHEQMKAHKVEDIAIARWLKKSGVQVACFTGIKEIQCRMYTGFREAVNGFTKNVAAFFGNSLLLSVLFWCVTTLGWIVVFSNLGWENGLLYLSLLLSTRVLVSLTAKQFVIRNLVFWIPQQITFGIILYKSLLYRINHQYQWKGRNIR